MAWTAEDVAFRDAVRHFFEREYPQHVRAKLAAGTRLEKSDQIASQQALNARGWLGVGWPKDSGGTGWTATQRYIFDAELERAGAAPIIPMAVIYIGPILAAFGTPEQQQRWLPDILESRSFWAQGYSEVEAGSDLASLRFSAVRDGDSYILNGSKIWTSGAHWADWIFCLARTSTEARKQDGISMICVDMHDAGVTVWPIPMIDGSVELNRVTFDNVRVPVANRIGEEGRGWFYANVLLKNERLSYAHIGAKRRDLAAIRSRAKGVANGHGTTMADDPLFQARMAKIAMDIDVIEATILRALGGEMAMATAAMLKIQCTECAQAITALAMELAGRNRAAFVARDGDDWGEAAPAVPDWAMVAPQSYLFERAQTIYGGSTEIQKNILWRSIA